MFVVAILVNVGMWFERFVIVVVSLSRDYLPSSWMMFYPTWVDLALLAGGFGLFATPFLLFIRFVPMVALSEVKACLPEADPHHPSPEPDGTGEGSRSRAESRFVRRRPRRPGLRGPGALQRTGRSAGGGRASPRGRVPPVRHVFAVPDPWHG